jgi:LDH2 family malate/lactate/ureidoglycolate dehydrogenase
MCSVQLVSGSLRADPTRVPPRFDYETKLSARMDGGKQLGMYTYALRMCHAHCWLPGICAMRVAVDCCVTKAKAHGFAIVGTHNTCSATGAIGFWARAIAREGLIGGAHRTH